MLGLSPPQVDLIENDVGGGFGARGEISSTADRRAALLQRGLLLGCVTLGWNVVGTAVIVAALGSAGRFRPPIVGAR
jgi:hypothetical protein